MTPLLRPARPTDAGSTGHILYRFQQDTTWMPRLYAEVETIAFCGTMIDRGWVTVAEVQGQVAGFLALDGSEVCALYVGANFRRAGVGAALLDHAKSQSPHLELYTFARNLGARGFYKRQGFVETGHRDGSANEEGLPDVALRWQHAANRADPATATALETLKEVAA